MKGIFGYSDYRILLKDWYEERKRGNPRFSYRYIAGKVGFKSPGHFTQILNGKANISMKLAEGFGEFMDLEKKERDFFQALVRFNQARIRGEKEKAWSRLLAFKSIRPVLISEGQSEYFGEWYYPVVRELLAVRPFDGDFARLGAAVSPPLAADQARRALEVLVRLGLVRKDAQGRYSRVDEVVSAGQDARPEILERFAAAQARLGREALERIPKGERNHSWVTLSISRERYLEILEELRSFRRSLLAMARRDKRPEAVYQINFQAFPVSERLGGERT